MSAPTARRLPIKGRVVGISHMLVSDCVDDTLITYSLGSCIGVSVYDPEARIGGLIHCMLPLSKIDTARAEICPEMFVDTGIPALLSAVFAAGADKQKLVVKLAGGASSLVGADRFRIGERNCTVLRKILWKNDLLIAGEEIGGTTPRTVTLSIATGRVEIRSGGEVREL